MSNVTLEILDDGSRELRVRLPKFPAEVLANYHTAARKKKLPVEVVERFILEKSCADAAPVLRAARDALLKTDAQLEVERVQRLAELELAKRARPKSNERIRALATPPPLPEDEDPEKKPDNQAEAPPPAE